MGKRRRRHWCASDNICDSALVAPEVHVRSIDKQPRTSSEVRGRLRGTRPWMPTTKSTVDVSGTRPAGLHSHERKFPTNVHGIHLTLRAFMEIKTNVSGSWRAFMEMNVHREINLLLLMKMLLVATKRTLRFDFFQNCKRRQKGDRDKYEDGEPTGKRRGTAAHGRTLLVCAAYLHIDRRTRMRLCRIITYWH